MFALSVENDVGEKLQLTNNRNYITKIEGLTPATANIATSVLSGMDGSKLNRANIPNRNIVLTIYPQIPIEENRIFLYRWFMPGKEITIYYANGERAVHIDGVIEACEGDLFQQTEVLQVSIICPQPYFISDDVTYINANYLTSMFEFPCAIAEVGIKFSEYKYRESIYIENVGDLTTGMKIIMRASGRVTQPSVYNRETVEFFGVDFTMQSSDVIEINTAQGKKSVRLIRDGLTTNLINSVLPKSTWLQVKPGTSVFTYESAYIENLTVEFLFNPMFGGV